MTDYTIFPARGIVVRNSDKKTVSPCQSNKDPDFVAYIEWVNAGNTPEIDPSLEEGSNPEGDPSNVTSLG